MRHPTPMMWGLMSASYRAAQSTALPCRPIIRSCNSPYTSNRITYIQLGRGQRRGRSGAWRCVPAAMAMSSAIALAAPDESSKPTVRLVTYNVLSSSLCEPSWFSKCKAENLSPDTRLQRVLQLLERELSSSPCAVFCLQEVSREWCGPLHVWFARKGYQVATSLYGHKGNGYMGVALAWPATRLEARRVEIVRLADLVRTVPQKTSPPEPTFFTRLGQALDIILKRNRNYRPQFDTWNVALRRDNTMIAAEFETTSGDTFCIAGYHMPCLYGSLEKERVMVIHAKLAADFVHRFARGQPYVLAGDFNIKPRDATYALLTQGHLSDQFADHAPPEHPNLAESFTPTLQEPLHSAYVAKLGAEPDFTNFAYTIRSPTDEPFVETLDYIFCKPNAWTVLDVKALATKDQIDLNAPYPDDREPSDHVLLAADLSLAHSSQ